MKIAYISYSRIPSREANSIHVMKMCQAFRQEGHDTTLFMPLEEESGVDADSLWNAYGIHSPFSLRYIDVRRYPAPSLKDHGYALKALVNIRRARISLVYTRHLYGAMWASLSGIPTVFEAHSPVVGGKLGALYWTALLKGKGFRRLVVITHALRQLFPKGSLGEDRIIVAPDGIDLERFDNFPDARESRRRLDMNPYRLVVGYAGHLYEGRGLELIYALAKNLPGTMFLIMGGLEKDIARQKKRAEESGLTNIILTGFLENGILPDYLAACDVLLMPYQRKVATINSTDDTSRWMSPMKMFEYMATGRLVISSDLPVLREVLNEANAVLCDPENPADWQKAIERALSDTKWRDRLGRKARADVEGFTWRRRVGNILSSIAM